MKNVWLFCLLVCSSVGFAQSNLPQPPGAHVIDITAKGYFNEPAVAINPANPKQMIVAYQVDASACYSQDGGTSWTIAKNTKSTNYKRSGDMAAIYDAKGTAIIAYLGFDKLGTENYWAHNATRNGLFVRRSTDGGKTWDKDDHAVKENPTAAGIPFEDKPGIAADITNSPYRGNLYIGWTEFSLTKTVILFSRSTDGGKTWDKDDHPVKENPSAAGIPFEDKPGIAADTTNSPYRGNLYIGWTEFSLTKTIILFSRSTDGGVTWSTPIEISTHEGLPRDDNGAVEGFSAAVASDGTLYAAWADANNIAFATSHDGGKTFTPSRQIIEHPAPYFPIPGTSRANGFPQLGIDPRSGLLFLTWSDYRNGDIDVFAATSSDQGNTWAAPVRVSTNPIHDGTDQFFQWLAVDPTDGSANIIFYDRRRDEANKKMAISLARSIDGGKTFANYSWVSDGFDGGDQFIGDYTGIAAYGGKVLGAWSETRDPKDPKKHSTLVRVGVADFSK